MEREHQASAPAGERAPRGEMFLPGAGEMGALFRAIDWATTPLGVMAAWPQSLRTTMSICLSSRFPIAVYWGPDYSMLYNESLVPMIGPQKHPLSLGQPAHLVLAEIWQIIEPLLRQVRETGEATWSQDLMLPLARTGVPEESYFTFTYSPIRDESGGVGGVFCAAIETTDAVIEGRRLRLLNALAESVRSTTPAAACAHAARQIALAPADVPFALLYLRDDGGVDHLAGAANVTAGCAQAPLALRAGDDSPWKLAEGTGEPALVSLREGPGGARAALILPIERAVGGRRFGFIVAGLSPLLTQSPSYARFHKLLAASISQGVSGAAAFEEERKRAEALAELDRAKTAFFSNVSHEFRTPLTLMLGPLEELAASSRIPEAERVQLAGVRRNSQRILKLVNSLLDFSRIEAGRMRATFEPTDLSRLTTGFASAFESVVKEAGLRLVVDCPPLPEPVWVDRDMWEKVVLNLVSNAYKFTFEGEISVQLRWLGDRAELSVRDTGTGIAEAELRHIFERFHRVEGAKSRSHEGSGIGLALVRELVNLHGGRVAVQSAFGRGTTFTVSLRAGDAHLPAALAVDPRRTNLTSETGAGAFVDEASQWLRSPSPSPSPSPSMFSGANVEEASRGSSSRESARATQGRVLLADDNADMRDYVRRTLEGTFVVEAVGDGQTALEVARANPPDVVLSDVMMPGLDGFALLREIRADPRTADVPVILLSARAGEEATVEGLTAGATDYLVKPFSARELCARVGAAVKAAQGQAERERLLAEVEVARHRLHNLIANAPAVVCVLRGPNHVYEMVNPHCQRMLGAGRRLLGLSVAEAIPELAQQGFIERLDAVYRTGEAFFGNEVFARLDRSGSGRLEDSFINIVCQATRSAEGEVVGIDAFGFDVTDLVLARNKAESLTAQLQLGDQRKDEFLAMLAHELRNPMAAISMALSMLERCEGDATLTAKYRSTARRQMGSLVRLVDDLLDVSRITRGKVDLRKEEVDLAQVVQNALAATRPTIEARGHELSVTLASGPFRLEADATRLEQVVVNLLTNAAKYTEPGGKVFVRLEREEAGGEAHAVLSVRDSGRGIPGDMLDKIFDMFVQVSPTIDRNTGGLGLGLTLVKRLVEMHGGGVVARSAGSGHGSEFVIRLPLPSWGKAAVGTGDEPAAAGRVAPLRRRILIVEDSKDVRDTLKHFLEALGHDVIVAADGLEGLAKATELHPDVSLVDVGLPGIDGYELARRVRARAGGNEVFLVALTGYGGPDAKAKAENAGFDLHLTKPVDINDLPQVVTRRRTVN